MLAAIRPLDLRAVYLFYLSYMSAAACFVGSLYLLLPALREAGVANLHYFDYHLSFASYAVDFSLPWYLPFLLVSVSAWLLVLSKRREYSIWRHAHQEFFEQYHAHFGPEGIEGLSLRRVTAAAKARARAIRWIALLGQSLCGVLLMLGVLLWLEPGAVPATVLVLLLLLLVFRRAIWHAAPGPAERGMHDTIAHRMRLVSVQQILYALMPVTVFLLLFFSRFGLQFGFDLADLLFISVLISALGNMVASGIQVLLRLMRLDESLLQCWRPLYEGNAAALVKRLNAISAGDREDDDEDD